MGQQLHKYENLLNREFHADRPNRKWVTDISYIHTKQGVLYLSMIRDLYDNSIVAYKTGTQQTVNLVLDTIRLAMEQLKGSGVKISIATKSDLILRDLDLIKTFPDARVSWSVNTLDENFKNDMDSAVSIQRRLAAMKAFHDAGIRTTCFVSPIFPGITDGKAIIGRAKGQCNLIWLENLNLRGSYKAAILDYIRERYPQLVPLYQEIYQKGNRTYWELLDRELKRYAAEIGLDYVTSDNSMKRPFDAPPVIVNYFYHEQIKKSARR